MTLKLKSDLHEEKKNYTFMAKNVYRKGSFLAHEIILSDV